MADSTPKTTLAPGGRPGFRPAAPHPREEERLNSLHSLHVLDSDHEKRYDDLTRLVADIFDVPICLVSLVDEDRQWFKAHCGLDARQTDRDLAFCAHALHEERFLVINDARQDERFFDNALVTGPPHVCFYAGAVLRDSSGLPLGTLCLIDHKPRQLDTAQLERLERCALLVENELIQRDALLAERARATLQANIDPITGYSLRRRYLQRMTSWQEGPASQGALQVILVKLQNAERLRKQKGVEFYEGVLQSLSHQLNENFDDDDVLKGRISHDTLMILLPRDQALHGMRWYRFVEQPWLLHLAANNRPELLIGAGTFFSDGMSAAELVGVVEEELVCASEWAPKEKGVQIADLTDNLKLRLELNNRFAQALRDNELCIHLQPIVAAERQSLSGQEVLLRWQDKDRWITPHQMLRIASHAGLGEELDIWVLRRSCALLSHWQATRTDSKSLLPLSINITASRLMETDYMDALRRVLRLYRLKGDCIRLDVSGVESFVATPEPLTLAMKSLANDGISFCVDRFGPEHDSLRLLSMLPITSVKLHPRWISLLQTDPRQARLLKAWTAALHALEISAVAVGIEHLRQRQTMIDLGFDQLQGYAFGEPMAPDEDYGKWKARVESSIELHADNSSDT
ncbi:MULTISPECIES: sensor domain-containing phosphodiesterase [Cobetia]|uniref:EAL domain-containing protein n=1 Tax=Cobetia TaxID=204286 RepID=UPI0006943F68|nr:MULTISPECIES: sensor domain-containing phosphodiesterase [Cobetia]MDH2298016.1 sensor domain-containing phosphodiesterase [Cobetia sp. 29-18-1]